MKNNILFCLILMLSFSCQRSQKQGNNSSLEGIWLGASVRLDPGVYRPINQILEIDSSGINLWNGLEDDPFTSFQIENDSIKIGKSKRPIHEFKKYKDILEIGDFQPFIYHALNPVPLKKSNQEVYELLTKSGWENSDHFLQFFGDSLIIYDHESKTREKICWSLEDFRNLKFIQKKGSFSSCEYPTRGIDYVTKINEDILEIFRMVDEQLVKKIYKRTALPPPLYKYPEFRLCNPYIYRNSFSDRYPFKYTNFEGGLYSLQKLFEQEFKPVIKGSNSGLVRIGFVINCVGEIGNFDVLELDEDYKKTRMNPAIASQLLEILQRNQEWNPGTWYDREIDTYKFLSFRLNEGRIIDIFP